MPRWIMLSIGLLLLADAQAQAPAAAPTGSAALQPAEWFYGHAEFDDAKLSPAGDLLAVKVATPNGRVGLFVLNLRDIAQSKQAARYADRDIRNFWWVGNQRLVYNTIDTTEGSGEQRYAAGLFSVKADGSQPRLLVQLDRPLFTERQVGREPLAYNHYLLHVPSGQVEGDEQIIVGEYKWDAHGDFRNVHAKRLNIVDGRYASLSQGVPEGASGWFFEPDGTPRVVETVRGGRFKVHLREAGGSWQQIADFDQMRVGFDVVAVDGNTLYVDSASGHGGTAELTRYDLQQRKLADEPFVRTPGFDFRGSLLREQDGGRVLGVRVDTDAPTTIWFEPRIKAFQEAADKRFPGRINRLSCSRCLSDDAVVLVRSFADVDPGVWWIHRPAAGSWQRVGAERRNIDPRRMATLDFHRIKARDGLEMPLWLTVPRGVRPSPGDAAKAAPAVVLVHGGPWVRGGHWEWQATEQFLASRGYVVIAPEFRGSRGYGQNHLEAGFKQWGRAMQDDIADAVLWAAKQGWVDPGRVCIAGASYGGYATLMGLIRHPQHYRCGVAWVAVTDPLLLFKDIWNSDISEDIKLYSMPQMVGDPVTDAEMLKSVSPVQLAAHLKKPLLLAMGREDRRVPIEHGDALVKAMAAAGLKPQYVVYDGEGHGWQKLETQRDFFERMEKFLAEHLR